MLTGTLLGSAWLMTPAAAQDAAVAAPTTTQDMLENPSPEDWLLIHGNYAAHRFSQLDQINLENIDQLELAYAFAIEGVEGGGSRYANAQLEGTPVVEDGIMYFPNGWGVVYRVDVSDPTFANPQWKMDPAIDKPWAADVACCGVNNRGVALWQDKVISVALDGRLIASDKATGEILWDQAIADPALGETFTVGPLVMNNIAVVGPAGAEYGIRGWLEGRNLDTGEQIWRTYTVAGPGEPGGETWVNPGTYETGGGSIWVTGTFDPELNLMYWGTGNPGPDWDAEYRPGDNLYTDSALAMTPETGEIVWYFQYTPNDPYDYDEISEHHIVEVSINGEERKLALHAGRNGYFYGLDAASGEFVYGRQYTNDMSWTTGLDPKTGRPLEYDPATAVQAYVEGATPRRDGTVGTVCPIHTGGKNWEPAAYNPNLQLLFVAGGEGCNQRVTAIETGPATAGGTWKPRDRFVGGGGPEGGPVPPANPAWVVREAGALTAINVVTGEVEEKLMLDYFNRSGVLATAGNWVMIGELDGWVRAFNAETLDEVWRFNVGSAIKGPPISYSVDGRQYVALLVGSAVGNAQRQVNPRLNFFTPNHMLYVFTLDDDVL
ncbi:MAG: PQQ-binding-like beta-propeller repeat protein [Bauldia sp.]|nr:PQQ-binding-like beta-propeller repeat protein [Bauldia sp.]